MEVIRTACPQFRSLEINLTVLPPMEDNINHHNGILSLLAAKNNDPTATKTTITPTACFEKLVLESDTWGEDERIYKNAWFKYIQFKYPGLKRVEYDCKRIKGFII